MIAAPVSPIVTVKVGGQWKVGRRLAQDGDRLLVSIWRLRPTARGLVAVEAVTAVRAWQVRERR